MNWRFYEGSCGVYTLVNWVRFRLILPAVLVPIFVVCLYKSVAVERERERLCAIEESEAAARDRTSPPGAIYIPSVECGGWSSMPQQHPATIVTFALGFPAWLAAWPIALLGVSRLFHVAWAAGVFVFWYYAGLYVDSRLRRLKTSMVLPKPLAVVTGFLQILAPFVLFFVGLSVLIDRHGGWRGNNRWFAVVLIGWSLVGTGLLIKSYYERRSRMHLPSSFSK